MLTVSLALALLTAAPTAQAATARQAAPDTLVICPEAFRSPLAPWLELRASQGHHCQVIKPDSVDGLRQQIRAIAKQGALRYIVLVGDAPVENQSANSLVTVPTHYVPSQVIMRFGGEKVIAGDNWYADLDDDQLPDVAIGRLPADSAEDLRTMIDKILAYERGPAPGNWRRRINLVAGLGGFGALADAAIEASAKRLLIDGIPPAYATSVTYGSWRSPYCPDPQLFHASTVDRFNEGCLFWVYMGHGHTRTVDRVRTPDGQHHIFNTDDCGKLQCGARSPIALLLCCSTGGFDQRDDCLAEELLRTKDGPVAALAGSRVTMPYAMSVLGAEMLRIYFAEECMTVGDLLAAAKRAMISRPRDDERSQTIDALAKMLNPASVDLALERAEHLELFNLIGDPLLKLPRAATAEITAPKNIRSGEPLEISGSTPIDGDVEVELVVRRDRLTFRPTPRTKYESSAAAREEYQRTYARANDTRLVSQVTKSADGKFRATLAVPATASGECHVRVFVQGVQDIAVGATDITIEPSVAMKK
ncbi:MAG TPA: C25 family cysteine peptidase [Pirellulales bacterium]|jgi:hypothetical protein